MEHESERGPVLQHEWFCDKTLGQSTCDNLIQSTGFNGVYRICFALTAFFTSSPSS